MLLEHIKEAKPEQQLQGRQSLQDELNQLDADTFEIEDLADATLVADVCSTTSSTTSTSCGSSSCA